LFVVTYNEANASLEREVDFDDGPLGLLEYMQLIVVDLTP